MSTNYTSYLATHKEHIYDREVDPKYLPHWTVLRRDGESEHFPVCTEELVCVILN